MDAPTQHHGFKRIENANRCKGDVILLGDQIDERAGSVSCLNIARMNRCVLPVFFMAIIFSSG